MSCSKVNQVDIQYECTAAAAGWRGGIMEKTKKLSLQTHALEGQTVAMNPWWMSKKLAEYFSARNQMCPSR